MNLSETYKEKLMMVEQDKEIYKVRGDKFEKEFSTCSDELGKCMANTPSRATWFGIGFVSAVVLGTAAAVAIK